MEDKNIKKLLDAASNLQKAINDAGKQPWKDNTYSHWLINTTLFEFLCHVAVPDNIRFLYCPPLVEVAKLDPSLKREADIRHIEKCPHGYKFGIDWDKGVICESCMKSEGCEKEHYHKCLMKKEEEKINHL